MTFLDRKWGWLEQAAAREGLRLVRASLGRHGESEVLQRSDEELVALTRIDLAQMLGIEATPVDTRVTRWGGALPQYAVGHRARVERIREGLRDLPTLALCGATSRAWAWPPAWAPPTRPRPAWPAGSSRPEVPWLIPASRASGPARASAPATSTTSSATRCGRSTGWCRERRGLVASRPGGGRRAEDVALRGAYDVGGLRGDADLMLWWHGPTAESLQDAYRAVAGAGERLEPVWSQMALHRPAEFNRSHVPAFLAEERARDWVCVYPFVRSYEWYLLEESERRAMLVEHGQMGRDYPDVRANTVASFALGDYEWILAFEADELHRIVDLMRHLRGSTARRHVREETPFYTGRRTDPDRPTRCSAGDRCASCRTAPPTSSWPRRWPSVRPTRP